jgi:hypothetical protein
MHVLAWRGPASPGQSGQPWYGVEGHGWRGQRGGVRLRTSRRGEAVQARPGAAGSVLVSRGPARQSRLVLVRPGLVRLGMAVLARRCLVRRAWSGAARYVGLGSLGKAWPGWVEPVPSWSGSQVVASSGRVRLCLSRHGLEGIGSAVQEGLGAVGRGGTRRGGVPAGIGSRGMARARSFGHGRDRGDRRDMARQSRKAWAVLETRGSLGVAVLARQGRQGAARSERRGSHAPARQSGQCSALQGPTGHGAAWNGGGSRGWSRCRRSCGAGRGRRGKQRARW